MSYFFDLEVKQSNGGIFISQEVYAKEIFKRFKMEDCKPISIPIDCGVKLSKFDEGKMMDPTLYKSLVGSLRYLTYTRSDTLCRVGLLSHFIEEPKSIHWKAAKRIFHYI